MERDARKAIADRIDRRLKELGISADAASSRAGRHRGYINQFKAGKKSRSLKWETLVEIAEALDCDVCWLATGRPAPSDNPAVLEALAILGNLSDGRLSRELDSLRDAERAEIAEREERARASTTTAAE